MQVAERGIVALRQRAERNGTCPAQVDLPFSFADRTPRNKEMGKKDGREPPFIFRLPGVHPALHFVQKFFVRIFILFQPRLIGIRQDVDEHFLLARMKHDMICPCFHGKNAPVLAEFGDMPCISVHIDSQFFRKGCGGGQADVVVMVPADEQNTAFLTRDLFDRFVKEVFRFRRGKKGIEHVARHQNEIDPLSVADARDLFESGPLLVQTVSARKPFSYMPIGCVQNFHTFSA